MEYSMTETLPLDQFIQIITNTFDKNQFRDYIEKREEQESKHEEEKVGLYESNLEEVQKWQFNSIKEVTTGKDEHEIIELIRNELGVVEDEVSRWNKMINAISKVSINDNSFKIG